ncbi:MAG: hypothetical protein ACFE0J_12120 [Elainellaceae cyanobacterium]
MHKFVLSLTGLICVGSLMLSSSGCSRVRFLLPGQQFSDVSIGIQVEPLQAGRYRLYGTADLPNQTDLAVAAVRYLRPSSTSHADSRPSEGELTYSILDYQEIDVSQNGWEVTLNLWEVAPDGRYQEDWQIQQEELGLEFIPEDDVMFVAMPAPITALPLLERQLGRERSRFANELVRFTPDGERYIQVSLAEAVDLPTGQTTPPVLEPQDINGGWGDRYVLYPEPQTDVELEMPDQRRTNAPPSPEEFLR